MKSTHQGKQKIYSKEYKDHKKKSQFRLNSCVHVFRYKWPIDSTVLLKHCACIIIIREYGSTLYVGMTRVKNGGRIKRVH